MNWDIQLIALYDWVCESFNSGAGLYSQRLSKNANSFRLEFTDEETVTLYLFGLIRKYREVKAIHQYARAHLSDWFPQLPSYEKFNKRLNYLNNVFGVLAQMAMSQQSIPAWLLACQSKPDAVVDSMPIILAMGKRADAGQVARQVANRGRCPAKGFFYHGLKLHHLGLSNPGKMPIPQCLLLSPASENDVTFFKEQIAPKFTNLSVYGDRIFHDQAGAKELKERYDIELIACQKRKKGQKHLHADQKYFSTMVSQIRQPVESFFNWINDKTGIQVASKVRSLKGLFKHIYARLTAAILILLGF